MNSVTIYHNPRCSKSRQTLELLQDKGIEPEIVLYLDNPPDSATLQSLTQMLGVTAREIIRTSESEYNELGLDDDNLDENHLFKVMTKYPKLIQRPIVVSNGKAAIGRPPEQVLNIL